MLVCIGEAEVDQLESAVEINQQILGFEVAVDNPQLVQILHSCDELPKELTGLMLLQPFLFYYQFEELPLRDVLHHQEELLGSLDDLVQLDHVGMPNLLKDVDFPGHSLHVSHVGNATFLQHLYSHPLASD